MADREPTDIVRVVNPALPLPLPQWPLGFCGAPAPFLRSSLFGVFRRPPGEWRGSVEMPSWGDDRLVVSGPYLSQFDATVWYEILNRASRSQTTSFSCSFRDFLRSIGKNGGGRSIRELIASLNRLLGSVVQVYRGRGKGAWAGHLLSAYDLPADGRTFGCIVHPRLFEMFEPDYVRLLQHHRRDLRGPLTLWLYGYVESNVASPGNPHRCRAVRLQELCGSSSSPKRFREGVHSSLSQLQECGVLRSFEVRGRGETTWYSWIRHS